MAAIYKNIETGKVLEASCEGCMDGLLKAYQKQGGKYKAMADKVVKIPEELYRKVKAKADNDDISMAKALDRIVEGKPLPEEVEAFIPSCAEEEGVKMPKDYRWIKPLTDVLPKGLRGKLEPYAKVIECAEAKAELKKLAENHLEEVEEVAPEEVTPGEVLQTSPLPPE